MDSEIEPTLLSHDAQSFDYHHSAVVGFAIPVMHQHRYM